VYLADKLGLNKLGKGARKLKNISKFFKKKPKFDEN
jgi:hypothetical protein